MARWREDEQTRWREDKRTKWREDKGTRGRENEERRGRGNEVEREREGEAASRLGDNVPSDEIARSERVETYVTTLLLGGKI